jgi:hypothetical protein
MPTLEEQRTDPEAADRSIDDFVAVLRARTRDSSKFPLVIAENANYGFRRNSLALRAWAVGVASSTLVVSAIAGVRVGQTYSVQAGYSMSETPLDESSAIVLPCGA